MTKPVNLTSRDLACIWHPYTQMKTAPASAADRPRRGQSTFTPKMGAVCSTASHRGGSISTGMRILR